MRLDFNVLWVEDQQNNVQSQRDRIELQIKKEGFRLKVKFASSIEDAKSFLSDDIYGDHIDLILMDYDLGAGGKGDQGLKEVRNLFQYKDIVFYSSQAQDLLKMVADMRIQGVFCSTRDGLTDTVEGVFEALVKKVLDIDHSRGIVMGATSDIDQYVNDCLVMSFDQTDDDGQKEALKLIEKRIAEKRKDFEKEIKKIEGTQHVSDLLDFYNIYTSNDRLRLLKNILEKDEAYGKKVEVILKYLSDTVPKRNLLAHVRVKVDGFSRKLFDKKDTEFSNDQMKLLRQELLDFQEHFENLTEELNRATSVD